MSRLSTLPPTALLNDRVVRDPEATAITGLSRTRRHELTQLGRFPRKVRLSERASGYLHSELMAWLATRPRSGDADTKT